jgi:hypothetical protein
MTQSDLPSALMLTLAGIIGLGFSRCPPWKYSTCTSKAVLV